MRRYGSRVGEGHRVQHSEVMGILLASFSVHLDERSVYLRMFSLPLAEKQVINFINPMDNFNLCAFSLWYKVIDIFSENHL
jgi:hypothetical protein